jgi:hypothetical protein
MGLLETKLLFAKQSKDVADLVNSPKRCSHYDEIVFGATKKIMEQRPTLRFDANLVLQTYEMAIDVDKRIIKQMVQQSWLRENFDNFPSEKMFFEYTGVNPVDKLYLPQLMAATGANNANQDAQIANYNSESEVEVVRAYASSLRRPIVEKAYGFYLGLNDLEVAAAKSMSLQEILSDSVATSLALFEQNFALKSTFGNAPEEKGLFNNTAIDSTITTTINWDTAATGRAILDNINSIIAKIVEKTVSVFEKKMPVCIITSRKNINILKRTYGDLNGKSVLEFLTERDIRIGGMPVIPNNTMYVYYNHPMNLELSTARMVEARPQSYSAEKLAYFVPYRNVTAGLTVKRPESIYKVTGIGA